MAALPPRSIKQFHAPENVSGRTLLRICITLSFCIHDMHDQENQSWDAKVAHLSKILGQQSTIFTSTWTITPSFIGENVKVIHPFLLARDEVKRIAIFVFRSTVSTYCKADVWTDLHAFANNKDYAGPRHSGFTKRAETIPVQPILNFLNQGWKVILTGHSLGGAVASLTTSNVIDRLIKAGYTEDMIDVYCITFGSPQVAANIYWQTFASWYAHFNHYIMENDAVFAALAFGHQLIVAGYNWLKKRRTTPLVFIPHDIGVLDAADWVVDQLKENFIPQYCAFGRHYFLDAAGNVRACKWEQYQEHESMLKTGNWLAELESTSAFISRCKVRDLYTHGNYVRPLCASLNAGTDNRGAVPTLVIVSGVPDDIIEPEYKFTAKVIMPLRNTLPIYLTINGTFASFVQSVELPEEIQFVKTQNFLLFWNRDLKLPTGPQLSLMTDPLRCTEILLPSSETSVNYLNTHLTSNRAFDIKVHTCFGTVTVATTVVKDEGINVTANMGPIELLIYSYWSCLYAVPNPTNVYKKAISFLTCQDALSELFTSVNALCHLPDEDLSTQTQTRGRESNKARAKRLLELDQRFAQYLSYVHCTPSLESIVASALVKLPSTEEESTFMQNQILQLKDIGQSHVSYNTDLCKEARAVWEDYRHRGTWHTEKVFGLYTQIRLSLNFDEITKCADELRNQNDPTLLPKALMTALCPIWFTMVKLKRLSLEETILQQLRTQHKFWAKIDRYRKTGNIHYARFLSIFAFFVPQWENTIKNIQLESMKTIVTAAECILNSLGVEEKSSSSYEDTDIDSDPRRSWSLFSSICDRPNVTALVNDGVLSDTQWNNVFTTNPLRGISNQYKREMWMNTIKTIQSLVRIRRLMSKSRPKILICGLQQRGKTVLFEAWTCPFATQSSRNTRFPKQVSIKLHTPYPTTVNDVDIDLVDTPGTNDISQLGSFMLIRLLRSADAIVFVTSHAQANSADDAKCLATVIAQSRRTCPILVLVNQMDLIVCTRYEMASTSSSNPNIYDPNFADQGDVKTSKVPFDPTVTLQEEFKRVSKELADNLKGRGLYDMTVTGRIQMHPAILKPVSTSLLLLDQFNKQSAEWKNSHYTIHKTALWLLERIGTPT